MAVFKKSSRKIPTCYGHRTNLADNICVQTSKYKLNILSVTFISKSYNKYKNKFINSVLGNENRFIPKRHFNLSSPEK